MSKSVAKAPRDGIGREKKRGISTFLLARPGSIRAFATDLDNCATRAPRRGAAAAWTATMTSTPTAGWARGNAARPRARHLTREHVPLADVLAGQVTCSAVTRRSRGLRRRPTRPPGRPGAETCTSHSRVQFQPSFSSAKCASRRGRRGARRPRLWPTLNKISFGCCYRQVFEVVVEGAAGDVVGEG